MSEFLVYYRKSKDFTKLTISRPHKRLVLDIRESEQHQIALRGSYLLKFPHFHCQNLDTYLQSALEIQIPRYNGLSPPTGGTKWSQLDKPTNNTPEIQILVQINFLSLIICLNLDLTFQEFELYKLWIRKRHRVLPAQKSYDCQIRS